MEITRQPSRILVYGLLNPITNELFYVGQTRKRREFRLLEHIEEAVAGSQLPVHRYIRQLMDNGRIPQIFVLERVADVSRADEIEIRWIRHFSSRLIEAPPIRVTPQTAKSTEVEIRAVNLQNVLHAKPPTNTEQAGGDQPTTRRGVDE